MKSLCAVYLFLVMLFSISICQEHIGEYLDKLGRSLKYRLSHPGKDHETLLRDLFDYYNNLKEVHTNITSGDEKIVKESLDFVQELIESGGPPHLNIEIDFDEFLFKIFKNDRDVQAIDNVLKDNRKTWDKLKSIYEKHAQI